MSATAPVADDSGVATLDQESFSGGVSLNGTYFDLRHQSSSGLGYQHGYTQFGAFAPIWGSENWYVAPQGRMILGDDAATGFNAGLVSRVYSEQWDRIFGANVYYDWDQPTDGKRYGQVGFGVESLGPVLDVRANAYLPTDSDPNFVRETGLSSTLAFFDHRVGFLGSQLVEQSLKGGDFEVGVPLSPDTPWLRGYAGVYAYQQDGGDDPVGFRGRVEGWVSNDLSLGVIVTDDNQFGTNVNAVVDWRFAGFQPTRYFPNWSTRDRMLMPVQRQWRVTVGQFEQTDEIRVAAANPRDGQTYFVVWVDPSRTAADPGDGTFEHPFRELPATVPNETDLVLVTRGDTTAALPTSGSIALPDFARMLGQGHAHVFDAVATFGSFTRSVNDALLPDPRFRNTGLYPFLTSPGDIVTVGNHNEVAAFVMTGAGGAAITGPNVSGFHFHHMEIANNAGGGIVLPAAGGTGAVTTDGQIILGGQITDINRNTVVGWSNPLGLGNNGTPGGISITTGIAPLDLNMARVSMNATPGGQDFGVQLVTAQGGLNVVMQDVSVRGGNDVAGLSLEQNQGALDAAIDLLDASDNTGVGVRLLSGNLRTMSVAGTNVTANGNVGDNLQIAGAGSATVDVVFSDSQFNNSTAGSGVTLDMTGGIKTLSLTNVSASGNALSGIAMSATGGTLNFSADTVTANTNGLNNLQIGTQAAPLTGTTFVGNVVDSFFNDSVAGSGIVFSQSGGTGTLNLTNIQANTNAVDGLGLFGSAATAMNVNVTDSQLTGNTRDAIHVEETGGAVVTLVVDPTDMTSSGRDALFFDLAGNSRLNVMFLDNALDNSGRSAVHGQLNASRVDLVFDNNTAANSGDDGFFLNAQNNSLANLTIRNTGGNGTFADSGQTVAGASGVELNGASSSEINLTMDATPAGNSAVGGSAGFGLTVNAQDAGTDVVATVTNGNFDNAAVNAVRATVTNGAVSTINLTDTTGANAGASGLDIALDTGFLTLNLTNADFLASGQAVVGNGLNATVDNGSLFNACILDSSFDGATGAGLRIVSTGAATESNIHFENSSANGNLQGGLVAIANAGSDLNLRTVGATFDGNGTVGLLDFDGVFVRADGPGSAARLLFNTTSADNNSRHGFNFEADNGAFMTARIDSISAQNNGGFGVRLDAQNAGTNAFLLPSGTNTVAGNGLGSYSITYTNTDSAVIGLVGSFNGLGTDGVHIDITNVDVAVVSLTGDGTDTIDSNGGDGVDIRITNVDQAGIRIAGYQSISSNTNDGIHIELTDIAGAGAIEILGPTQLTDNGDDGIDILLNNVVLGTFTAPPGLDPLSVITLTNNDPLNACVPEPTDVPFGSVVTVPTANGILIDQQTITRTGGAPAAGQNGIDINGTNVTGAGQIQMTNNTITNYDNGINGSFAGGGSFGGVLVDNTTIDQSAVSGINLVYNTSGSPITISNSIITDSGATGVSVALTNGPGAFDINVLNTSATNSGGHGLAVVASGTDVGTVDISNNTVANSTAGDGILLTLDSNIGGDVTLTNNTVDQSANTGIHLILDGAVGGANVTVSTSTVTNSGLSGITLSGDSAILGDVAVTTSSTTNSGGDGIEVNLPNATVASLLLDTLTIDQSTGHGLDVFIQGITGTPTIDVVDVTVTNSGARGVSIDGTGAVSTVGDVTLTNVSSDAALAEEGVAIEFNTAGTSVGAINLTNVSANLSGAGGILIDLNGISVGSPIALTGGANSFSTNNGGDGIRINLTDLATVADVSVTGYELPGNLAGVDNNAGHGIAVVGSGTTQIGTVDISNNFVDNSTAGDGIHLELTNLAVAGPVTMDSNDVDNSFGDGIRLALDGVTGGADVSTTNSDIDNSGAIGINLTAVGATLGTVLLDPSTVNNSGLDGVRLDLMNATVADVRVEDFTISNSGLNLTGVGDGLEINADGLTSPAGITILNTTVTNSESRGVYIHGNAAINLGDITLTDVSSTSTSNQEGVFVEFSNGTIGSVNLNNVSATDSAATGIRVVLGGALTVGPTVSIDGQGTAVADDNGGSGITLTLSNVTGTPDVTVTGYNSVDSNGASGIRVLSNASNVGDVTVSNNTVSNSLGGDGISIVLSGNQVGSLLVDTNAISDSNARGLDVVLNSVTGSPNVTVSNTTASNSGGRGISVQGDLATLGNVVLSDVSSDTTTADEGVALVLTNGSVGTIDFTNVSANASATTGILVDLNTETVVSPISLTGGPASFSTNNGGDGILVTLNTVVGTPDVSVTDYNLIDNNGGRGIAVLNNGSAVDAVTVSDNIVSNSNGGDGIEVTLSNAVGSVTLDGNTVSSSNNNGIDVQLLGVTGAPDVTISNSTVTDSATGDGVRLFTNGSVLNDLRIDTVSVTNSNIDGIAVLDVAGPGSSINSIVLSQVNSDTTTLGTGVTVQLNNTTNITNIGIIGGGTVINSAFDGINVVLTGAVTGTPDITIDGYTVDQSGNRGIFIDTNGSAVDDVNVSNNIVSNSTGGQGVDVDLTNSVVASVLVDNNTISDSFGRGLDVILDGVTGTPTIDVTDVTVTNSGGRGVSVAGVGSAGNPMTLGTITLTDVSSDTTTAEEGVAVVLSADAVANGKVSDITLTNVSALNSFGVGILTDLDTMTIDPAITLNGQGTAQSVGNGGDGILVTIFNVTSVPTPLDISVDNYALVDNNAGRGIAVLTNGSAVGDISVSNNSAISNSTAGQGVLIDLTNSAVGSVLVDTNTITDSSGRGLDIVLDGVTGAPTIAVSNINVSNSGGRGVSVEGTGSVVNPMSIGDVSLTFVTSTTTTAGEGVAVVFNADAVANGTVGSILLNDVGAASSNGGGILVDLNTVTVGPAITLDGQANAQVTANGGDGILVDLDAITGTPNVSVANYTQIGTNTGSGIVISQSNAADVGTVDITSNVIASNAINGVEFQVAGSAQGQVTLTENQITGQTGGDGVNVVQLDDTDGVIDFDFFRNSITGNTAGRGVNFTLPNPASPNIVLNADFTNDTVDSNGLEGLLVDMTVSATTDMTANIGIHSDAGTANPFSGAIASSFSNNGRMGVLLDASRALVTNTADVNLIIDGNGTANLFDANGEAGVAINLAGGDGATIGATGTATVSNASFTNTVNTGVITNFNGEGFAVFLNDNAAFDNATLGDLALNNTTFSNNAGSGFALTTNSFSKSDSLTIQNSTFQNNTGNGLTFLRNANVPVSAAYISNVTIDGNTIEQNQRGIDISAEFANGVDSYTITDNTIDSNRRTGIRMFMQADADLNVTIGGATAADGNQITNNGTANVAGDNNGIQATENLGPTDVGVLFSTISNNTITGNQNNGISVIALHTLDINNNVISNNIAGDGITITGSSTDGTNPTTDNIAFNAINNNGNNGITINVAGILQVDIHDNNALVFGGTGGINDNGGDGIQLNSVGGGILTANVDSNDVISSGGDGVQLLVSNTGTSLLLTQNVTITNNIVSESGLRGINVLNAADTRTNLTIDDNLVDRSQREGVYIVNTSVTGATGLGGAGTQGIDALADTAMATADTFLNDPRLALNVNGNTITSNGQAASDAQLFNATGLVLRIGTSDASNSFTDNGGFASGFTSATIAAGPTVAGMTRGGVAANITTNTFGGQFGSDVTFQAFTSTVAPPTTTGTWTDNNDNPRNNANDVFTVNSFTSDPLSRLDLRFTATNTGDGSIVTRTDVFGGTNPAFYNNDEPIFKSRTTGQDGNDPADATGDDGGPFSSGARRRNATRLAARAPAPFNLPTFNINGTSGSSDTFLYPGVSDLSTFRISGDTTDGGFTSATGFGTVNFAGAIVGERPFFWDALP